MHHNTKAKPSRCPSWWVESEVANPMSLPQSEASPELWLPKWEGVWCQITAEDGTTGIGMTSHGRAVAAVIEDHLAAIARRRLLCHRKAGGHDVSADQPYGTTGLASYAISVLICTVGFARQIAQAASLSTAGRQAEGSHLLSYATGNDVDWYQGIGLPCSNSPVPMVLPMVGMASAKMKR